MEELYTLLPSLALAGASLVITYLVLSRAATVRHLHHIPGPTWASWTPLWLVRRHLRGRVSRDLAEISKQYGPISRIAPNMVLVSDPFEIRRVWQVRGPWYRSRWYDMFHFDQPVQTVLSLRDNAAHGALRAKLVPGYSGRDVDNLHSVVDRRIADFVDLIERKYLSTEGDYRPMDLAEKAEFMTLDVISDMAIGHCFGCLQEDRDTFGQIDFVTGSLPLLVVMAVVPGSLVLLRNPIARAFLPKDKIEGALRMQGLAKKNAAARYGPDKIVARDMLGSFVAQGLPYDNAWLETFGQIGAGTDTTATAIRMTMFYLMSSPESYGKLQNELDSAIESGRVSSPITESEAKQLPYLQAVIKEGMRTWPPVMGLMPKVCDTEQIVCGKRIPPGTDVCWDAITIMRNREIFGEDAECFRPDRWIDEKDPDRRKIMEQIQGLCFATSSRWECLGKSIALLELDKVFVELLRRFDFSLVNPMTPFSTYDVSIAIQSDMWVRVQKRHNK
ncbi:cytochrome P450 71A20 [Cercophora scortea]|uniref:Cytochrome P450 71A20 n=1 Tax=Cercophora scortea TaxID=314031 RepID=A0AAE0IEB4_9PEZI|nr:cytochrome P450 71A20 [Cercophora scortea]